MQGAFALSLAVRVCLATLVVFAAAPSWGSTFVLMSDAQLAAASNGAWLATVHSVESGMTREGRVYTYTTLLADRKLSGPSSMPDELVLRELGGRVGDTAMVVYGTPRFSMGERVVVFLEQVGDGTFRTYQHVMGKFRVETDVSTGQPIAVRDWGDNPDRVQLADPVTGELSVATADSRPLVELLATIRDATFATGVAPLRRPIVARPPELDRMTTENAPAPAFTYLGFRSRTEVFPDTLDYFVDTTPPAGISGHLPALQNAMWSWEHSTNNISLAAGNSVDIQLGYGGCGGNRIVNEDPAGEISPPASCAGMLAVGGYCAQGWHTGPRGEAYRTIVSSKVVFADGWGGCALWNVDNYTEIGAHELGHGIGFGHSAGAGNPDTSLTEAVMNGECCTGRGASPGQLTAQDDRLIAAHSYPSGQPVPYFVLDGFGGLHPGGGAPTPSPLPFYFGFDIARDLALTGASKGLVLDGFGGVHAFGGESTPFASVGYFGFDVAEAIAMVPGTDKFYVVDGFGGVHTGNGAAPTPGAPYFGFDIARDIAAAHDGAVYVLDGFGGVHAAGAAAMITPATPYFGFDIARDIELVGSSGRHYVIDGHGGVHRGGYPATIVPATPYFGSDIVRGAVLAQDGVSLLVLDAYGRVHAGGAAPSSPPTPYFGFDIARGLRTAR